MNSENFFNISAGAYLAAMITYIIYIVVKNKTTQTTKNQYFVKNYPDFNPDTMTPSGYGKFKKLDTTAIDNLTKQHNVYIQAKKITGLSAGQL